MVNKGRRWLKKTKRTVLRSAGVQQSDYYDAVYADSDEYKRHYADSIYYASWCVIVDRMKRAQCRRILDIGCGPGQFAAMLRDAGFTDYDGLDFSQQAVRMAKERVPELRFTVADALRSDMIGASYDVVVSLEFLEHVEPDLEVLARVRPGTHVLATVPNFPSHSHVRHFTSVPAVEERYRRVLDDLRVDMVRLNGQGTSLYVLDGRARGALA